MLNKTFIRRTDTHSSICCATDVDRLCCCDDEGHAGCVVGLATVSGEASGVDVMHKEVKRERAGREPGEWAEQH